MTQNGSHLVFPRGEGPRDFRSALTNGMAATSLRNWLADCTLHDEQGQPVHLSAHQFRYTLATRLINKDVPQEVVRKILDHSSTQMTAHYARQHDSTVRKHWETRPQSHHRRPARPHQPGQPAGRRCLDEAPPGESDHQFAHRLLRAAVAAELPTRERLPDLPCLHHHTELLGQQRERFAHTDLVLAGAREYGHLRLIEMNERVAASLTAIITTLENEDTAGDSEVNGAP